MRHFKRLIAGVTIAAMIGSLCACGGSDTSGNDTTQAVSENLTEDDSSDEQAATTEAPANDGDTASGNDDADTDDSEVTSSETIWELQDMDIDSAIPEHSVTDATSDEGKELKLVGARLGNPEDETLETLKANEWLSTLGVKADIHQEFGHTENSMVGTTGWYYRYRNGFGVFAESDDVIQLSYGSNFKIFYEYDTRNVNGVKYIGVYFNNLDVTDPDVQANVQDIVRTVYGEDFGNVLLFAKDEDPEYLADKPNNLKIRREYDDMVIQAARVLKEDEVYFTAEVKGYSDNSGGYSAGHVPDFSGLRSLPDAMFAGDVSGQALNSTDIFSSFRTTSNFRTDDAYMVEYDVNSIVAEDGRQFDEIKFKYDKTVDSSLWLEYNVGYRGDEIVNLGWGTGIMQSTDYSKSMDENLAITNASLSALLGQDVNITSADLGGSDSGTVTIETELFGEPRTLTVDILLNNQAYWKVVGCTSEQ